MNCPNCSEDAVEWIGTDASGEYEHGVCAYCGATVYERLDGYDEPEGYGS